MRRNPRCRARSWPTTTRVRKVCTLLRQREKIPFRPRTTCWAGRRRDIGYLITSVRIPLMLRLTAAADGSPFFETRSRPAERVCNVINQYCKSEHASSGAVGINPHTPVSDPVSIAHRTKMGYSCEGDYRSKG